MKKHFFLFAILAIFIFSSCKRIEIDITIPEGMTYVNLNNRTVAFQQGPVVLDIDHNSETDLIFSVWLVGDPILEQDKRQFRVSSGIHTRLAVNANEETPVMGIGDRIYLSAFNGYNWFEVSSIILVQRVEGLYGPIFWTGNWQAAYHRYLPFQLVRNGQRYNGWIELTVDISQEKIILHKAAYSNLPEKKIRAGF
ncbi:MAG: hypothetical protein QM725_00290 [Lacibacter sp.]